MRLTGVAGRLCGETSRFSLELLILTLLQLMGPMLVALLRLLFLLTELSGDVLAGLLPIDVA